MLVHGVGFGPETMEPVAREFDHDHEVVVVERRAYGSRSATPPGVSVAEHVQDVIAALDESAIERACLVGVSGGATIALAAVLARPDRVERAVAHEPAVGSLVPELRSGLREALDRGGVLALLEALAGPITWSRVSAGDRDALLERDQVIAADAEAFLAFEPDLPGDVEATALTCTVGERSGPLRIRVAERLRDRTGATVLTVCGAGHLAHIDTPAGFAEVVRSACAFDDREDER